MLTFAQTGAEDEVLGVKQGVFWGPIKHKHFMGRRVRAASFAKSCFEIVDSSRRPFCPTAMIFGDASI